VSERYLAIVNPAAGGGRCGQRAPAVVAELRAAGLNVEVRETSAAGQGTEIARQAFRDGVRRFIGVGGDGTSFEIVNGLFPEALEAKERPWLGFLPLGTGNSFLRDFTLQGAEYSKKALIEGRHRPCDVIRLRHRDGDLYYINILSFGFVADVCTIANRRFKAFGEAGYGLGVFYTVASMKCAPIPFSLDGGAHQGQPLAFVSFNNSRFTGGKMMMAPSADTGDGLCDVIVVNQLGRFSMVGTFPKIFDGSHVLHPAVQTHKAQGIAFRVQGPLDAMIDGEVISLWPERIDVMKHALEVCV
jgi:YegS/Rv2252/BmrU family lipid kinase